MNDSVIERERCRIPSIHAWVQWNIKEVQQKRYKVDNVIQVIPDDRQSRVCILWENDSPLLFKLEFGLYVCTRTDTERYTFIGKHPNKKKLVFLDDNLQWHVFNRKHVRRWRKVGIPPPQQVISILIGILVRKVAEEDLSQMLRPQRDLPSVNSSFVVEAIKKADDYLFSFDQGQQQRIEYWDYIVCRGCRASIKEEDAVCPHCALLNVQCKGNKHQRVTTQMKEEVEAVDPFVKVFSESTITFMTKFRTYYPKIPRNKTLQSLSLKCVTWAMLNGDVEKAVSVMVSGFHTNEGPTLPVLSECARMVVIKFFYDHPSRITEVEHWFFNTTPEFIEPFLHLETGITFLFFLLHICLKCGLHSLERAIEHRIWIRPNIIPLLNFAFERNMTMLYDWTIDHITKQFTLYQVFELPLWETIGMEWQNQILSRMANQNTAASMEPIDDFYDLGYQDEEEEPEENPNLCMMCNMVVTDDRCEICLDHVCAECLRNSNLCSFCDITVTTDDF
jgi:hypothetical protein